MKSHRHHGVILCLALWLTVSCRSVLDVISLVFDEQLSARSQRSWDYYGPLTVIATKFLCFFLAMAMIQIVRGGLTRTTTPVS